MHDTRGITSFALQFVIISNFTLVHCQLVNNFQIQLWRIPMLFSFEILNRIENWIIFLNDFNRIYSFHAIANLRKTTYYVKFYLTVLILLLCWFSPLCAVCLQQKMWGEDAGGHWRLKCSTVHSFEVCFNTSSSQGRCVCECTPISMGKRRVISLLLIYTGWDEHLDMF